MRPKGVVREVSPGGSTSHPSERRVGCCRGRGRAARHQNVPSTLALSFVSVDVFSTNGSAIASWPSGTATTASGNSKRPRVSVCQASRAMPPSRALGTNTLKRTPMALSRKATRLEAWKSHAGKAAQAMRATKAQPEGGHAFQPTNATAPIPLPTAKAGQCLATCACQCAIRRPACAKPAARGNRRNPRCRRSPPVSESARHCAPTSLR